MTTTTVDSRRQLRASDIPGIPELWRETTGHPDVVIAFIDGAVDIGHPSLVNARIRHLDTPPFSSSVADRSGSRHGTHVVSIVLGQHGSTIEGIAPLCQGIVVPVFRENSDGRSVVISQLDLARAIVYALGQGATIINISGGQADRTGKPIPLLADALAECERNETLVVAAAGNDGRDVLQVPAAFPSVLVAGATDRRGNVLRSTNWGDRYGAHGVLAPGEDVLGAMSGGGVAGGTGTSYAAAVTTGVAALMISSELQGGRRVTAAAIRDALVASGPLGLRRMTGRAPGARIRPQITRARELLSKGVEVMADSVTVAGVTSAGTPADIFNELVTEEPDDATAEAVPAPSSSLETDPGARGGDSSTHHCATCETGEVGGSGYQLVYAIGEPGCDLVSEARRDSLTQHMGVDQYADNPVQLLDYFEASPWESESIEWTLNLGATPIYAIRPEGAFARDGYDRMRESVRDYMSGQIERVTVAGVIVGQTQLMSGQVVPVVRPELRCGYTWTTNALLESVAGIAPDASARQKERDNYSARAEAVRNFLERVYEDFRNLGLSPQERAINVTGTNAFTAAQVFSAALQNDMQLDTVGVERSPICPPGSDCWEVRLTFFNPAKQLEQARRVYKFDVDVTDVCPRMIGRVRSWSIR